MLSRTRFSVALSYVLAVETLLTTPELSQAQPAGRGGTTIVVNTTTDLNVIHLPGQPPVCRLRDAIQAANTNQPVAGCLAGKQHSV
jgi:hypothetical protein